MVSSPEENGIVVISKRSTTPSHITGAIPVYYNYADLLVAYLEQLRVEYVFGVPGGAIEPLFNALARTARHGGMRAIVARHESASAFMAAGYTANSGKLGVCCSTTGPGATNLITGVASAYQNNIPMLVITPQTVLSNFGRGALQESSCTGINTVGMFEFCTKYNTLISHIDQFEHKLSAAIVSAIQTRTPSHISIPLDIQRIRLEACTPSFNLTNMLGYSPLPDPLGLKEFGRRLISSEHAVFVIGDGCNDAIGPILACAALLNAKVVTTPHGKGLVNTYHPLFRGVIGFAGHSTAVEALSDKHIDTIVAIGTALTEWASNGWDTKTLLNEKLIHVDASEGHFMYSPMANLHVRGKISAIFENMLSAIFHSAECRVRHEARQNGLPHTSKPGEEPSTRHFLLDEESKYEDDGIPIKPQRLMHELPKLFPPDTRYFADPGNSLTWAIHYLHPFDRRSMGSRYYKNALFQSSLEFASMGWAIGAAIGAALAEPDSPIVCMIGDGSLLMTSHELTVAVQEDLTIIFIILNDAALGMVKHGQRLAHAEYTAYDLPIMNYQLYAKSMGMDAYIIESPSDLLELKELELHTKRGPTLLDVHIDAEETPPMKARMQVLGSMNELLEILE